MSNSSRGREAKIHTSLHALHVQVIVITEALLRRMCRPAVFWKNILKLNWMNAVAGQPELRTIESAAGREPSRWIIHT